MKRIVPTNTCFDDVTGWINHFFPIYGVKEIQEYFVIHGLINDECGLHVHCWLENPKKKIAIDFGLDDEGKVAIKFKMKEFYKLKKVQEKTIYTMKEVAMMSAQCKTLMNACGPWKIKYLITCRDYSPIHNYKLFEDQGKVVFYE